MARISAFNVLSIIFFVCAPVSVFAQSCLNNTAPAQCQSIDTSGNYSKCLMQKESSGLATAVSANTPSIGIYQWQGPALNDLGVCSSSTIDNCGWNGSFLNSYNATRPAGSKITRLSCCGNSLSAARSCTNKSCTDAFLSESGRDLQQKLATQWDSILDQRIKAMGLDKCCGEVIGGVTMTKEAMRAMAHLGGAGALQDFLKSNGTENGTDKNKVPVSGYGGCITLCLKEGQNMAKCNMLQWGGSCFKPLTLQPGANTPGGTGP
jgi:hypothetical protein